MAEWSIAAVLKTVEGHTSGGSNPSLSAKALNIQGFIFLPALAKSSAWFHRRYAIHSFYETIF